MPTEMRDRWLSRPEPAASEGTVYWHVLMRDHPEVVEAAREAQSLLSHFPGFHVTPPEWLHMTTLLVGSTADVGPSAWAAMVRAATDKLAKVAPAQVSVGRILYHPEAVMLGVEPVDALRPIQVAVREATVGVLDHPGAGEDTGSWTPHVTVTYSTADQDAGPVIAALGRAIPRRETLIDRISLVVQWGPEREWDWEPVGTIRIGQGAQRQDGPNRVRSASDLR